MHDFISGDPSTDFGHAADDARANASEAMVFANAADNSLNTTDRDTTNHEAFDPDTADATDADILEYFNILMASNPEHGRPAFVQTHSPPPQDQGEPLATTPPVSPTVQDHSYTSGTWRQLVVDQFPYGSPGAPIPEGPQGTSVYQATQNNLGPNIWLLFTSQMDWELARWAKLSGPSASAFMELLAIPEVSVHAFLSARLSSLLIHVNRSLAGLPCHIQQPMNLMVSSTRSCLGAHRSRPENYASVMKLSHCIIET